MNRFYVLIVVALVWVQQGAALNLNREALEHVLNLETVKANNVDDICKTYDMVMRDGPYAQDVANLNRQQLLEAIIESVGNFDEPKYQARVPEVLDNARKCLKAITEPEFQSSGSGSVISHKHTLNFNVLEHLLDPSLKSSSSVSERCSIYEAGLRNGIHGKEIANINRVELLRAILENAWERLHSCPAAKREDAVRLLNDVQECLNHVPTSDATTPVESSALSHLFDRSQLVELSKAHQEMKSLTLDHRCKLFDEQLRVILKQSGNPLASASKAVLFQNVISELGGRQLPFNNKQPFLIALEECASNLSEYRPESGPVRTVIAGPFPSDPIVAPVPSPMEKALEEFKEVKNKNIKDLGQDLYNKNQAGILPTHDQHLEHPHELGGHGENQPTIQHDAHSGGQYFPTPQVHNQIISNEAQKSLPLELPNQHSVRPDELHLKKHHEHIDEHFGHDGEHKISGHQNGHSHELRFNDNHPFEKNHNQENSELRDLEKRLSAQVKRNFALESEIENGNLVRSKLERQVTDLQRQLTVAQEASRKNNQKHHDRHNDDSDDDDKDDDDDDDDDDYSIGDVIRDLSRKQEKKQENKKEKKGKRKNKKEDGDKVYKEPVDIARKLQEKMNSNESPENRCQKYYMAVNHGGKVTKKFLKMLAKIQLPKSISQDPEYFDSLSRLAQRLANSGQKYSQQASREIKHCLNNKPAYPAVAHFNPAPVQHHSYDPKEIPVIDARTKQRDFSRQASFSGPPSVNNYYDSKGYEAPVTYEYGNKAKGPRNWSYSHASASASGGQLGTFVDFPRIPVRWD